ncbi:DEHA2D05500p [Debaryomyces hansenii CBS767]|uniref:DEHA2D05500p n=1 Tax=Debaryomyces hansenii (strain ATCC 36239 / CBS 767 / BCRC 21394 / JCM 1990 / NBRC 0083 / IGC 2968) TaxID=284592 RepID=Q6BSW3_DEBHA|nr:DEHA2D05500p [Debaryomyces hansenii CBS767]CAG86847.2 DEHA2D05500p [Debaryomyces hansenii CBS767]|eukprot:XP_458707.2 DEHA2D05500p [Debaryomyces hansenii CBS767]
MVLINGVKYACERCIRGHRVTTCTHTDQPLTMIKPKGRPATQCQHCRDQRKNKNLHIVCTCGKKGKSPGMHLASCQCHKNSHCTCSSNASKKSDTKKKLQKSMSELSIRKEPETAGGSVVFNDRPGGSSIDAERPFEMGNGLFDMFSPSSDSYSAASIPGTSSALNSSVRAPTPRLITKSRSVDSQFPGDSSIDTSITADTNPNTTINENINRLPPNSDMVDNMFPLFPLVGNSSFSNSKDQPLSPIPDHVRAKLNQSSNLSGSSVNDKNDNINAALSHYQPIRPKRPESSLSITSNSSTASRPNPDMENFNYSNIPTSSANPPNSFNFSPDGANQNNDLTSNSLFDSQYESFINSLGQEERRDIPQTNPEFDKKSNQNQNQSNLDLELHPMFTELMLPMKYNNSKRDE